MSTLPRAAQHGGTLPIHLPNDRLQTTRQGAESSLSNSTPIPSHYTPSALHYKQYELFCRPDPLRESMRASNTRPQLLSSHLTKIECLPLQLNASSLEQSPRPRSLSSFAFRLSHPSFCPNTTLFTPTTSCYTTTRFLPFHSIFESYESFSIDWNATS